MLFKNIFAPIPKTGKPETPMVEQQVEDEINYHEQVSRVGVFSNVGSRENQQDSYGVVETENGILAIVADGMGGLSDGEKVSSLIAKTFASHIKNATFKDSKYQLFEILSEANFAVNEMLGVDNLYKSGSTVVAAFIQKDLYDFVAVGDSHIYLYRDGILTLLNREHAYEADLIRNAVNKKIAFSEIDTDPQKEGLMSFIGMGDLRYVDGSYAPEPILKNDKLLLMSDGIYNSISKMRMEEILKDEKDVQSAATKIGEEVVSMNYEGQDNMTILVVDMN